MFNICTSITPEYNQLKNSYLKLFDFIRQYDNELFNSISSVLDSTEEEPYLCSSFCSRVQRVSSEIDLSNITEHYFELRKSIESQFKNRDQTIFFRFAVTFLNFSSIFFELSQGSLSRYKFEETSKATHLASEVLKRSVSDYSNFLKKIQLNDTVLYNFIESNYSLNSKDVLLTSDLTNRIKDFKSKHLDQVFFPSIHLFWDERMVYFKEPEIIVISGVFAKFRDISYILSAN